MKKIILLVLILLTIPFLSGAMELGAGFDCKVWRIGMPIPYVDVPGNTYCKVSAAEESRERIYQLEVAVSDLQNKLSSCQSVGSSDNSVESRLLALESKTTNLENLFSQLRTLLLQIIQLLLKK